MILPLTHCFSNPFFGPLSLSAVLVWPALLNAIGQLVEAADCPSGVCMDVDLALVGLSELVVVELSELVFPVLFELERHPALAAVAIAVNAPINRRRVCLLPISPFMDNLSNESSGNTTRRGGKKIHNVIEEVFTI